MPMLAFVNDALMAVFFFVIGLEIKQEVLIGELSSGRKAILPVIAACGGMKEEKDRKHAGLPSQWLPISLLPLPFWDFWGSGFL